MGSKRRYDVSLVTSRSAPAQHLRDLAVLRRVRDRIDREYAQPLDVEALARGALMSAGHLSRQFRLAFGESPYSYLMTRRIDVQRLSVLAVDPVADAAQNREVAQVLRGGGPGGHEQIVPSRRPRSAAPRPRARHPAPVCSRHGDLDV